MRSTSFFAALLVAVALGVLVLVRLSDEPAATASRGTVTLLGDSLNVGVERYLPDALPGWRIVANDRVGRSTPEGIAELEAGRPQPLLPRRRQPRDERPAGGRRGVPGRRRPRARARRPEPVRRLGHDLARRGPERRLQRRAPRRGRGEPPRAARRMGRDGPNPPRAAGRRRPARQRGRLPRARPRGRGGDDGLCPGPDRERAMTRVVELSTGAEARLRNESAPAAVVLVNGGSAKAVPGTWSATSELLATELAPRFPNLAFAEVRYRLKTWKALDSCLADARAALDLVARPTLLVGFSMGGAVSIGVAAHPSVDRRARPRSVDSRAAVARRPPRQAARRAPRSLGPLPPRDPRSAPRQLAAGLRARAAARDRGHLHGDPERPARGCAAPRAGPDRAPAALGRVGRRGAGAARAHGLSDVRLQSDVRVAHQ